MGREALGGVVVTVANRTWYESMLRGLEVII